MKALYKKGNLDSIGEKFAGVSGKTVKRINAYVGEEGEPGISLTSPMEPPSTSQLDRILT
jgi:hypothetical protein